MIVPAAYRALLHLYPRRFRREYGDDMVALVSDQLRDEHALRVIARTVLDLVITVPNRHLEAHMKRSSTTAVVIALAALGVVLAVVGGPIGLLACAAAFGVAALTWRASRPVVATGDTRWWKLLLAGIGLLAALVAITSATGELPEGGWFVAMFVGLLSLVLMAAGIVLGISSRFSRAA